MSEAHATSLNHFENGIWNLGAPDILVVKNITHQIIKWSGNVTFKERSDCTRNEINTACHEKNVQVHVKKSIILIHHKRAHPFEELICAPNEMWESTESGIHGFLQPN